MTITEFLLARIAEDEAVAQEYVAVHGDWKLNDPIGMDEMGCQDCSPVLAINTSRVLAECKAKRAIVELADEASGLDVQVDGEFRVGPRDEAAEPYVGDSIHRALAAVYSDHADYRQEWVVK